MLKTSAFCFASLICCLSSPATLITFDDVTAPELFQLANPLRDEYAALGAHFIGPGDLDGGAILNQDSGFGVVPISGLNFLAFVSEPSVKMLNGGNPKGPETIKFDVAQDLVSFYISGGWDPATCKVSFFDQDGNLIESLEVQTEAEVWSWVKYSPGKKIGSLMIDYDSIACVVDDLTFEVVPEPATLLLGAPLLVRLAWRRKK